MCFHCGFLIVLEVFVVLVMAMLVGCMELLQLRFVGGYCRGEGHLCGAMTQASLVNSIGIWPTLLRKLEL